MMIGQVLSQLDLGLAPHVLDLCAAPGGKSLNVLSALPNAGLLSNELIRSRAGILEENLSKWGSTQVFTCQERPEVIGASSLRFDLILVDAPCSGEGLFRRDPMAAEHWSLSQVEFCAERQSTILRDIAPCVKAGGYLLYSTCTYAPAENQQADRVLLEQGFEPVPIELNPEWGFHQLDEVQSGYQAYPHRVEGEGFFFAVYRRGEEQEEHQLEPRRVRPKSKQKLPNLPSGFPRINQGLTEQDEHGNLYWCTEELVEWRNSLSAELRLRRRGVELGQWKGKDFIPHTQAALIPGFVDYPSVELDLEQALAYLRKDTLSLDSSASGWHQVKYQGLTMGWGKLISGRLKNHYPKPWRLRLQ
jgi:NOL1/NOP2/fmu family ribosome biogenesis protein